MKKALLVLLLGASAFALVYLNNSVTAQEISTSNSYGYNFDLGFYEKNSSAIKYKMESRYFHTLSKSKLLTATSIREILPQKATLGINALHKVSIGLLNKEQNIIIQGADENLNKAQLELLETLTYSQGIFVKGFYREKSLYTSELEEKELIYYLTIVPEKEANYIDGYISFIDYLKSNSIEKTLSIDTKKLEPGRILFTVNSAGLIENIHLESSSGYKSLDQNLLELLATMPQKWEPAKDGNGKKVNQELVFFFGAEGC